MQLKGPDAARLAQILCVRDLSDQKIGQGKYVALCNHRGVLLNDPIALKVSEDTYWLSIGDSDIWFWAACVAGERGLDVEISEPDVSPLDDEMPFVSVSTIVDVDENSSGVGSATFTLDRAAPLGGVVVPYTVTGTATEGTDYTSLNRSLSFAEGETGVTVEIDPIDDERDEGGAETVVITLEESFSTYRLGDSGRATIDVTDTDTAAVLISETEFTFDEGDSVSYDVVLTSDPGVGETGGTNFVTILLGGVDDLDVSGDVSISAGTGTTSVYRLVFDNSDWDVPKTVTLERSRDFEVTGDQSYTISHTVLTAGDYADVTIDDVEVTVNEVDSTPGITITAGPDGFVGSDLYANRTDLIPVAFTISLESVPQEPVLITLSHDYVPGTLVTGEAEPNILISPDNDTSTPNESAIILSATNMSVDVKLTRLAGDLTDGNGERVDLGEETLNVSFEIDDRSDPQYVGVTIDPIEVAIVPLVEAGFSLTPVDGTDLDTLTLTEGQSFDTQVNLFEEGFFLIN